MRLLRGGAGQVGQEVRALTLASKAKPISDQTTDAATITRIIRSERWDAVINAPAYIDVNRAESEEQLAFAVNAQGPAQRE